MGDNPMNLTRIKLDVCLIFYIYHQGKTAKPNASIYRLLLENPIELIKSGYNRLRIVYSYSKIYWLNLQYEK